MSGKRIGWYIFVIIIGAVIGTVFGDALAAALPPSTLKTILLKSHPFGLRPSTIDLKILTFTLGFTINLNVIGAFCVFITSYVLIWVEKKG